MYILLHIHENKVQSENVVCSDVHIPHSLKTIPYGGFPVGLKKRKPLFLEENCEN